MKHVFHKVKQVYHGVIDLGRPLAWDLVAFTGAASVWGGLWWIYPPLALIVVGAGLVALAVWGARQWPR
jgi:hypothetical protein